MTYRTVVYDSAITRMNSRRGSIGRWASGLGREAKTIMIAKSPKGATGELARSHHYRTRHRTTSVVVNAYNDAPHALFVHEGTGLLGPLHHMITMPPGRYMSWVGESGKVVARKTKGQKPQPWMTESLEVQARRHRWV